ncbi:flagellin N-terminal helical domain-containing protein [Alicyclobacillus mengziensis]|uniref:Flagellin n=1 Tax=Alicyclobacillus mengziensis TaxID=2931921 RepID=A0A9X7W0W6_9BACL|nr:flagellin [Alicyclobacillus mengziensis]QSO48147.1 hypothetical protein JZ786_03825 [Alicyclobacillus mengziensis]
MSSGFWINFNPSANNVLSNMNTVNNQIQQESQVMSTGNSVNNAADNPAAYAISQNMIMNSNGLNVAVQNAQQGTAMIQTATGAQQQVLGILQTMNQLATQASQSGTQTVSDRAGLQLEMNSLANEINSITNQTQYNGLNILSGQFSTATGGQTATLQVGSDQGQTISFNISATDVNSLGVAGIAATGSTGYATGTATLSAGISSTAASGSIALTPTNLAPVSNSILETGSYQVVFNGNYAAKGATSTVGALSSGTLQLQIKDSNGTWENVGNAVAVTAGTTSVTVGDAASGAAVSFAFNTTTYATTTLATAGGSGTISQSDSFSLTGTATTSGTDTNNWTASTNVVGLNVLTQSSAANAITKIHNAISQVTAQEEQLGAVQNRLSATISDLNNTSSNLSSANQTIIGANMAKEQSQFAQSQVLEQAGISVLSQVNQQPAMILKLLG